MLGIKSEDWVSIGKGAGIAAVGAGLSYLLTALPGLPGLGIYGPVVGALCSILANIVRKKFEQ